MEQSIRQAQPHDLALLLHWGQALHHVEQQFEPQLHFSFADAQARYAFELSNPQALFLIAEASGQAVGYLYAHLDATPPYFQITAQECVIEVVYLDPLARGKGFAQALVEWCYRWANERSVWRFTTGVYALNQDSLYLFQRLGFRPYHITLVKEV